MSETKTVEIQAGKPTVITEGDEGWPRPRYLAAACQLLGMQATVETHGGQPFRITLPHSVRVTEQIKETAQKIEDSVDDPRVGATGEHPEEPIDESDGGEMQFSVGAMVEERLVVVSFGKPVAWLGMSAIDARTLADLLNKQATTIEAAEAEAAAGVPS